MQPHQLKNTLTIACLFAVIAILFSWPALENMKNWGIQDWDWFLMFDGLTRESILQYGQMPLWNPYWKGGMPLLAHPESNIFSPAFLTQLCFGEIVAAKINIALHLFIGLGGMYLLARRFQLKATSSFLAAIIFMLSSMYALALTVGMEWGYGIAYMPWVFYCFLRAEEKFAWTIGASLVLAVMWLGGGVYPFTISLLLMGTYTLAAVCCREMDLKRGVRILAAISLCTFLLGAVKFLPAVEFTLQHTRHSDLYAGLSVESLLHGLFSRDQTLAAILGKSREPGFWRGFSQGMDETGMYVGILPFVLFLLGLASRARKFLPLLVCLFISLWLGFGNRTEPLSLWEALRLVPPYSIMRSVERFRLVVVMILAIFAGAGHDYLAGWLRTRFRENIWPERVSSVVVFLILTDLFLVNGSILKDAFSIPPFETPPRAEFRQIGGFPEYDKNGPRFNGGFDLYTSFGASYPAWLANMGSVYAYEDMPIPENALVVPDKNYRGEVFLEGTGGSAGYRLWTPNRLVVDLKAMEDGWLVINQNYFTGWRAKGLEITSRRGLLAVRVGPGVDRVELSYLPTTFVIGALISLLTLLATGGWYWRLRRTRIEVSG